MKKALLTGSLSLVLTGLGLAPTWNSTIAAPTVTAQTPATRQTTAPEVELLNPGAEPRQELRFKPVVNARQTAVMTFKIDMALTVAGNPAPTVKIPVSVVTVETVVNKVDPNGDIHYQFRYTKVDVIQDNTVPKPVMDAARSQNAKLMGISGSFVMDNRGQQKSGSFTIPASVDPITRQTLNQLSQSINQFSSPIPATPVGQGAQWRVSTPVTLNGITLTQTATYQVASIQNGNLTLDVTLKQQAYPQPLNQPGLPSGVTARLKSLNSQGQGKMTLRLDRILPIRSNISIKSINNVVATNAGNTQETTFDTRSSIEMQFESKP